DADVTVTVDTVPADLIGAITIPEGYGGDRVLHSPLRRPRQMCIRYSQLPLLLFSDTNAYFF
ncbi:hypothetical protein P5G19_14690, partial [Acinetobacter baumannii]